MRKLVTALGTLAFVASVACSAKNDTSSAAPTTPQTTTSAAPTATTAPGASKADDVRGAAVAANFPFALSSDDALVDAAGKAVCKVRTDGIGTNGKNAFAGLAAVTAMAPGFDDNSTKVSDSETIYNILYKSYCPQFAA
jgi:hypothetical protein